MKKGVITTLLIIGLLLHAIDLVSMETTFEPEKSQFFAAIKKNDIKYVQDRLSRNAECIHWYDEENDTPLVIAALCGHTQIMQLLINHGASVNEHDIYGQELLYRVLAYPFATLDVVKLLCQNGAHVNQQIFKNPLTQTRNSLSRNLIMCNTPLHIASELEGKQRKVRYLLACNANPMIQNEYGQTPLHMTVNKDIALMILAAFYIRKGNIQFLLSIKDGSGSTPLEYWRKIRDSKSMHPHWNLWMQEVIRLFEEAQNKSLPELPLGQKMIEDAKMAYQEVYDRR